MDNSFDLSDYRARLQAALAPPPPPEEGAGAAPSQDVGPPSAPPLGEGAQMAPPAVDSADNAQSTPPGQGSAFMGSSYGGTAPPLSVGPTGMPPPSMAEGGVPPLEPVDQGPGAGPALAAAPKKPAPAMDASGTGAGPSTQAPKGKDGKGQILTGPPDFDPTYNKKKLAKANTVSEILSAMDKPSRSEYMDWWEEQHGKIEDRYDHMMQQLGTRPDPNRTPTREEMFGVLGDVGMRMLQHAGSKGGRGNDPVAAAGQSGLEARQYQRDKQAGQTADWDRQATMIQNQRKGEEGSIGNYGNAVREDALITNAKVRTAQAIARQMQPPKAGQPTTRVLTNGVQVQYNPDNGVWETSRGEQGEPITPDKTIGPRGGQVRDQRTAGEKNFSFLKTKGVSDEDATNIAFHQRSGDARKDALTVFNTALRATMGDQDAAKQIQQQWISENYGEGAIEAQKGKRVIPASAPPPQLLKAGKITTFKDGTKWRLGPDGNPQKVQ